LYAFKKLFYLWDLQQVSPVEVVVCEKFRADRDKIPCRLRAADPMDLEILTGPGQEIHHVAPDKTTDTDNEQFFHAYSPALEEK
jgi:hypothetical protein